MAAGHSYPVHSGWRIVLRDLGLHPTDVLRRAGLPDDLFSRDKATLSTEEYFRLWRSVADESRDPTIAVRIGTSISVEAFDPPIFAALCSPDLNTSLWRLACYKRLICPMALHVEVTETATRLEFEWLDTTLSPPAVLVAAELVFIVQLGRIATRTRIAPLAVESPYVLEPGDAYREYFGAPVRRDKRPALLFHPDDARRPFLTANEKMWQFFEPELKRRLSELDQTASTTMRARAALLELLPSGSASVEAVAKRLGSSTRTLQRRLKEEGQSFQSVLNDTREHLARHYLKSSGYSGAEISFLLGFEDPNSFFRAFHSWTGTTPEQARSAMLAGSGTIDRQPRTPQSLLA